MARIEKVEPKSKKKTAQPKAELRKFRCEIPGKFHFHLNDRDDDGNQKRFTATKNDIVMHDRDLAKAFPGKWVEITPMVEAQQSTPVFDASTNTIANDGPRKDEVLDREGKEVTEEVEVELGEDVTEDFTVASENGYKVYKDGKKFFVTEDGKATAINPKPLKKNKVEDFIHSQLDTGEDEEEAEE